MELEPNWPEMTAVVGGTFDPPHLGHLKLVEGLFKNPGVGHVIILPAGNPPLKEAVSELEHRREMVKLAFASLPSEKLSFDFSEMNQTEVAPKQKTYTTFALERLAKKYSDLAFVLGVDQLANLPEWKNFPDILNQCHWIVVERKPHTKKKAVRVLHEFEKQSWLVGVDTSFKLVTTDAPEVSSSEIRKKSPSQTGIPAVDDYIHSHHLYQEK